MLPEIEPIVQRFNGISLAEMDSVKLMTRSDTKYLCRIDQLPSVLEAARSDYRILENHGQRILGYESLYFDTPGYEMYLKHHNRKRNRYKVRIRQYLASSEYFLEVKFKHNTGLTTKKRTPISPRKDLNDPIITEFLSTHSPYQPKQLKAVLFSRFYRMTLVGLRQVERITIDILPSWHFNGTMTELPYLVILELKGEKFTNTEGFGKILRDARIPRKRLSKYCTGINLLYPTLKFNRFKVKMLHLKKLDKNQQYVHLFAPFA